MKLTILILITLGINSSLYRISNHHKSKTPKTYQELVESNNMKCQEVCATYAKHLIYSDGECMRVENYSVSVYNKYSEDEIKNELFCYNREKSCAFVALGIDVELNGDSIECSLNDQQAGHLTTIIKAIENGFDTYPRIASGHSSSTCGFNHRKIKINDDNNDIEFLNSLMFDIESFILGEDYKNIEIKSLCRDETEYIVEPLVKLGYIFKSTKVVEEEIRRMSKKHRNY
jgi:hypothetical protein